MTESTADRTPRTSAETRPVRSETGHMSSETQQMGPTVPQSNPANACTNFDSTPTNLEASPTNINAASRPDPRFGSQFGDRVRRARLWSVIRDAERLSQARMTRERVWVVAQHDRLNHDLGLVKHLDADLSYLVRLGLLIREKGAGVRGVADYAVPLSLARIVERPTPPLERGGEEEAADDAADPREH